MKKAIASAERSKKLYEDGKAKVAEAGKALQSHANLLLDLKAADQQVNALEAKLAEMRAALDEAKTAAKDAEAAKEAVQVALEESERAKTSEFEAAVREAVKAYRYSTEFSNLLDREVGSEMAYLVYRFKRYNPGRKLNLNFIADPPPLPEGITEEMVEDYEGEDAPVADADAEDAPAEASGGHAEAVEGDQLADDAA